MHPMMRQRGVRRAIARLRWRALPPASAWLGRLAVAAALLAGSAGTAFAQLDPLLFLKTAQPNVLLLVDTANRMQRDAGGDYYDQYTYRTTGANWETPIGVQPGSASYRRKYINLRHLDTSLNIDTFEVGNPGQSPGILTIANNQAGSNSCGNLVP